MGKGAGIRCQSSQGVPAGRGSDRLRRVSVAWAERVRLLTAIWIGREMKAGDAAPLNTPKSARSTSPSLSKSAAMWPSRSGVSGQSGISAGTNGISQPVAQASKTPRSTSSTSPSRSKSAGAKVGIRRRPCPRWVVYRSRYHVCRAVNENEGRPVKSVRISLGTSAWFPASMQGESGFSRRSLKRRRPCPIFHRFRRRHS